MGSSGRFACEVGIAGSVPGKADCERVWNGPGILLHGCSPNLSAEEQIGSMTANNALQALLAYVVGTVEQTPLRDLSPRPS